MSVCWDSISHFSRRPQTHEYMGSINWIRWAIFKKDKVVVVWGRIYKEVGGELR